jgi:hypothetical protein
MARKTLPSKKAGAPSAKKAKTILSEGEVRGHPLTPKQRGLFGAIAGGARPRQRTAPRTPPEPPEKAERGRPLAIGERPITARPRSAKVRRMLGRTR